MNSLSRETTEKPGRLGEEPMTSTDDAAVRMAQEAMKDPALFAQVMRKEFDKIDIDGSGALSGFELEHHAGKTTADPASRAAVKVALDSFEDIKNLAHVEPNYVKQGGFFDKSMDQYFREERVRCSPSNNPFFPDQGPNVISQKDLTALSLVLEPDMQKGVLSAFRRSEMRYCAGQIADGVIGSAVLGGMGGMFTLGGAICFGLPGAIVCGGVTLVGLGGVAYRTYDHGKGIITSKQTLFEQELARQRMMINAWNVFRR